MTLGVNQSVIGTNAHTYIMPPYHNGNTTTVLYLSSNSVVVLSSGTQNKQQ
jgi:hypothetical protein